MNATIDIDGKSVRLVVRPYGRRLSEEAAAEYLGISKTTFRDGWQSTPPRFPAPIREGSRVLWDRVVLDRHVDEQSGIVAPPKAAEAGPSAFDKWGDRM